MFRIVYRRRTGGTIQIWDIRRGACLYFTKTTVPVQDVMAFLKDEDRIVTNGSGKTLLVWKIEKHLEKDNVHERLELCERSEIYVRSTVNCITLNNDGSKMVIGFGDKSVQLWNTNSMSPIYEQCSSHHAWISCISFSSDGTKVAIGSGDDTIRVRDVSTGRLVCPPLVRRSEQFDSVKGVGFTERDDNIISFSMGSMLRIWKIGQSLPEARLKDIRGNVISLSCSPDEPSSFVFHTEQGFQVFDVETGEVKDRSGSFSTEDMSRTIARVQIVPRNDGKTIFCRRHEREIRHGNE